MNFCAVLSRRRDISYLEIPKEERKGPSVAALAKAHWLYAGFDY